MSKLSKILIAVGIIMLVIGLIIFLLIKYNHPTQPQKPTVPSVSPEYSLPSFSDEKMSVKTKDGNSLSLNNVYRQSVEKLDQNGVDFKENSDYYMAYYPQDQSFVITILNPDIKNARYKAERDLLEALGIEDDSTACQLNVSITVPYNVNADASGQEYGLSFCPNGKPFK
jgi:hypothetical protein